jgi:hypothetical protein
VRTAAAFVGSVVGVLVAGCAMHGPATPVLGEHRIRIGSPPVLLLQQVHPVPAGNATRQGRLLELFGEAGCERIEERWRRGSGLPHVVCVLPGRTDATILVSANFDEPLERGLPDNWTGAAMLPSLYRALRVEERQHTYEFVGFADESPGRAGSPVASVRMVGRLPDEERAHLVALVSLKGLLLDVPAVWDTHADPDLSLDLHSVSRSLELPMRRVRFSVKRRQSRRVKESMMIEEPILPPPIDVPNILIGVADSQVGEYLDSFRLVAAYLGYLDQSLALRKRMEGSGAEPESSAAR